MAKTFGIRSAIIIVTSLACISMQAQQPAAVKHAEDPMNQARALLQKWAETEKMIAAERNEWEQGKTLLEGRISLVQKSIDELKKKIEEADLKLAEARKRAAEVQEEKRQATEATDELLGQAPEIERAMRSLLARIPRHVNEKAKVLADRIPKEGTDAKNITAAERFQNVLGILNELNKANMEITSLPEIHDVGGGRKAEAKTIYVGLGQAYFVNAAGDTAGVGVPGATGWVWRADSTIAKDMLEVLEVMKKSISPKLINLPVTID